MSGRLVAPHLPAVTSALAWTSARAGILTVDESGSVLDGDHTLAALFRCDRASLAGRKLARLVHPEDAASRAEIEAAVGPGADEPSRIEARFLRDEGGAFWARITVSPGLATHDGRRIAVVAVEDLSALRRADQRLALQHEVTRLLAAATTIGQEVLRAIARGLDRDVGVLWIADRDGRAMRLLESWVSPDRPARELLAETRKMRFPPGMGLPGLAWERRAPVWITDIPSAGPGFRRATAARIDGLHGAFAFPVLVGDHVHGVVEMWSREVCESDPDLIELSVTLGNQLGQFVARKRAEAALRGSRMQLQAILDNSSAVVIVVHAKGRLILLNRRGEEVFGLSRATAVGAPFGDLVPEAVAGVLADRHARVFEEDAQVDAELVLPRDEGARTYLAQTFLLNDGAAQPYAACSILTDITDRKRAEEDVRSLAAELSAAEDAARRKLARDIHDSIGQTLSALKLDLARMPRDLPRHGELIGSLTRSLGVVDDLISQARSLTFDLYPSMLDDLGLVPTLEAYCDRWGKESGLSVTLTERGERRDLTTPLASYLFRAVKELLCNVRKHAGATNAILAVQWKPGRLRIMVADDGHGFDPEVALAPARRHGLGLADLRQRVAHLGGEVLIEASAEQGTQIIVEVPAPDLGPA